MRIRKREGGGSFVKPRAFLSQLTSHSWVAPFFVCRSSTVLLLIQPQGVAAHPSSRAPLFRASEIAICTAEHTLQLVKPDLRHVGNQLLLLRPPLSADPLQLLFEFPEHLFKLFISLANIILRVSSFLS